MTYEIPTGANMFAYCMNNPVSMADDGGEWSHIIIGAGVGAVVGFVGQVISDVVTSAISGKVSISNVQTYAGAVVGGMAGGATLAATGNMNLANAITGAVTTGTSLALEKTMIDNYDKSWSEIAINAAVDGAVSYGLGKMPGLQGVTSGQNSWSAVFKSGLTRLRNGTAKKMSEKVIAKGMGSSVFGGLALDAYYGIKQFAYDQIIP